MESKQLPKVEDIDSAIESEIISPRGKENGKGTLADGKESLKENTGSSTQNKAENVSQPSLRSKMKTLQTECEVNIRGESNPMAFHVTYLEKNSSSLVSLDDIVYNKTLEPQDNSGISSPIIPDENVSSNKTKNSEKSSFAVSNETGLESKLGSLQISSRTEKVLENTKNLPLKSNLSTPVESASKKALPVPKTKLCHDVSRNIRNQPKRTEPLCKPPEKPTRYKKTQLKNPVIKQKDQLPPKVSQKKVPASQAFSSTQTRIIPSERKLSSSTQTSATKGCLADISRPVVPDVTTLENKEQLTGKSPSAAICETILENALNSLRTLSLESADEADSGNKAGLSRTSSSVFVDEGTSLNTAAESKINKHIEATLGNVSIQENETFFKPSGASATKTRQEMKTTPTNILKNRIECKGTSPQLSGNTTIDETASENAASESQINTPQLPGDASVDETASENTASESRINRFDNLDEDKFRCFKILRSSCLSWISELSISIPSYMSMENDIATAGSLEWPKLHQETSLEDHEREINQPSMDKLSLGAKSNENKSESYRKEPDTKNQDNSTRVNFSHFPKSSVKFDPNFFDTRRMFGLNRFPTLGDYKSWWIFPDCDKMIHCEFDDFLKFYNEKNPLGTKSSEEETPGCNDENYVNRNQSHFDSKMTVTKTAEIPPSRIPKRMSVTKSEINPNPSPVRQPLEKRTEITPSRIPVRQTTKKETGTNPSHTPVRKTPKKEIETNLSKTPVRQTLKKRTETNPS